MYIVIEHSGTDEHVKEAQEITSFAEDKLGVTCETVVGEYGPMRLYTENLQKFAEFYKKPGDHELYMYLALSINNDEE